MSSGINTDALLIAGRGAVLLAPVDAAKPTLAELVAFAADLTKLPAGWELQFETDIDDLPETSRDGGDSEVKGTWLRPAVRKIVKDTPVNKWTIKPLYLDNDTMAFYEGGGTTLAGNIFESPDTPGSNYRAATIVMIDGAQVVGRYLPKVDIGSDDSIELSTEDFTKLPLVMTELTSDTGKKRAWIGAAFGTEADPIG